MKGILLYILCSLFSSSIYAANPSEVKLSIDNLYIPLGFDSNDNVEVIVTGFLPNFCYKSPKAYFKRQGNKIDISLVSLFYEENLPYCSRIKVPFLQNISLGVLPAGNYVISVNGGHYSNENMVLDISQEQVSENDNHMYAGVGSIQQDYLNQSRRVVIEGVNPSDCLELDRIDLIPNKSQDTLAILPILKKTTQNCTYKLVPFKYEFLVPDSFSKNQILLHVRTIDGGSLNYIFNNLN